MTVTEKCAISSKDLVGQWLTILVLIPVSKTKGLGTNQIPIFKEDGTVVTNKVSDIKCS